MFRNSDDINLI
jgi:protein-tyrosine phosphatase